MKKLKLPNLHRGLVKDGDNPFNYIFIKHYHAIITDSYDMIVVDLKTYFSTKVDDQESEDLVSMLDLLEYLDGKMLSASYWEELTKGDEIEISEEDFIIINSKGVMKELHYVPPVFEEKKDGTTKESKDFYNSLFTILKAISTKEQLKVGILNLRVDLLNNLNSIFGGVLKGDNLIIETFGLDKQMRFTFNVNRHVFGIASNNYSINEELFVGSPMEALVQEYYNPDSKQTEL